MSPAVEQPKTFDAAAFVADLQASGCQVVLCTPGTWFEPGNEATTYLIKPASGYTTVMARWADAVDACPDHVERVVALLIERWEARLAMSQDPAGASS